MIQKILLLFFLSISLFGETINLALSANVSYAMDSIKEEFQRLYPSIKIRVIIGSSGKLTAQIKNGAPYDVFMSANMKYPKALYKDNLAITKPIVYAQGSLSFLSVKERDFSKGLKLLKSSRISKIAIANPHTAPYGQASYEALGNYGILDSIQKKIVYGESATQTLSYTMIAVDIGFIATSSLYSPKLRKYVKGKHYEDVDPSLYTPIDQGIVILKNAKYKKSVEKFYNFILSDNAKMIFQEYGYKTL